MLLNMTKTSLSA